MSAILKLEVWFILRINLLDLSIKILIISKLFLLHSTCSQWNYS